MSKTPNTVRPSDAAEDPRLPPNWRNKLRAFGVGVISPSGQRVPVSDERLLLEILAADRQAVVILGRYPRILLSDEDALLAAHRQFRLVQYMSDDLCDRKAAPSGVRYWEHRQGRRPRR
jgi:hypothetical protein